MTDQGAVYDLGYTPYGGERRGRSGARRTVYADGVRRVLGIRRKGRKKIMPWLLITVAVLPPVAFVGISFFIPVDVSDAFNAAELFVLGGTITLLFTALSAPELLIPDRRDGVLSMLSSRPMTPTDYISARFASLISVVGAFMLIPQFVLYVGLAASDPDGFLSGLIDGLGDIPRILVVAAIYVIAYVPLGFAVASLSNRKAVAAGVYLVTMLALSGMAEAIVQNATFAGSRWAALMAPINTADAAAAWVFGDNDPEALLSVAGVNPVWGIVVLAIVGTAATVFSVQRYRSLM